MNYLAGNFVAIIYTFPTGNGEGTECVVFLVVTGWFLDLWCMQSTSSQEFSSGLLSFLD